MVEVDPWGSDEISSSSNLFEEFGLSRLSEEEKRVIDHYLAERDLIVGGRDFGKISKCIESEEPFLQVTGIATSGGLHLGHKVDVDLFNCFQRLGAQSFFGVCDIDAYVSRPDKKVPSLEKAKKLATENAAHLLALGIDEDDLYVQGQKEPRYYEFAFENSKLLTKNAFEGIYGHLDPGKISANLLQYSDILHQQLQEFNGKMPSITGIGLEQDPHARACRDIVRKSSYDLELPSFVYLKHQRGLKEGKKMSASEPRTAIFLDDSEEEMRRKIDKAYTGGKETKEEHRKQGANLEEDKVYEILKYHHPNTERVREIGHKYATGEMLSGELKAIVKDFLSDFLNEHQKKVERKRDVAERLVRGKR